MAASPTTAETKSAALGLLIFDGDCGFCTYVARLFGDFAGESAIVAPWQALELGEFGLTQEDCVTAAYWVQDGQNYRGVDAFVHGLQVCRAPWNVVGKLIGLPPIVWVARGLYPIIAKYRHKLPGATDSCRID